MNQSSSSRPDLLIDLHSHTCESDGTLTADELVSAAVSSRLVALSITDHDTFAGYDKAVIPAREQGLELICGIELSTKMGLHPGRPSKSTHLLGYFLDKPAPDDFREWLHGLQRNRRDRNRRMAARLQELGINIHLEDVERLGRNQTGRPHFARVLLEKGYVRSLNEAFQRFIGETAKAYVHREDPGFDECVRKVKQAGGVPSLAHPVRLGPAPEPDLLIAKMCDLGLPAIEVYHSDHSEADVEHFLGLARRFGLGITGGSDFHGENKPGLSLGSGFNGNLAVKASVLDELREFARRNQSRLRSAG